MIDHAVSELAKERERMVFQVYLTDSAKTLIEVIAKAFGGNVQIQRYADLIEPKKEIVEKRSSAEIVDLIKTKVERLSGGEVNEPV